MRLHVFLRSSFLLLVAVSPLALRAQFQDPTSDELKMTSDPKAPGASAVYLYREETLSSDEGTETIYARIKVLAEKGKELATVQTPFVPGSTSVEKVEARTIHPDGRAIPLVAKPEDLTNFKSKYFREDTLVFTLPDVDVGSILEYRIRIHGIFMPSWDLQTAYFIHKEHFVFKPSSNYGGYWTLHGKPLNRLVATKTPVDAQIPIQTAKNQFVV